MKIPNWWKNFFKKKQDKPKPHYIEYRGLVIIRDKLFGFPMKRHMEIHLYEGYTEVVLKRIRKKKRKNGKT
jgi:hypothetical protein